MEEYQIRIQKKAVFAIPQTKEYQVYYLPVKNLLQGIEDGTRQCFAVYHMDELPGSKR